MLVAIEWLLAFLSSAWGWIIAAINVLFEILRYFKYSSVASFMALKVVLFALFVTVLPTVLYNLFFEISGTIVSYYITLLQDNVGQNVLYNFTGLSGWIAQRLRLPESFEIVLTASIVSYVTRRFI